MTSISKRTLLASILNGTVLVLMLLSLVVYQLFFVRSTSTHAASPQTDWQAVPLVSQEALSAGFTPGGEGGQVIRSIRWSQADPNFLMMATDVGGVYRSINGGDTWQSIALLSRLNVAVYVRSCSGQAGSVPIQG